MKMLKHMMWILAASTLAFSSCVEEQAITPENEVENETGKIEIIAGEAGTKTHYDGTLQIKWDSEETIQVIENTPDGFLSKSVNSHSVAPDGSNAYYNVDFTNNPKADSYNYWAIFPAKHFIGADNQNLSSFKLQIPTTQKSHANTFDHYADLLISKRIDKAKRPMDLYLSFARPIAIVEMTLKGITDGETLSEVTFSTESAPLAGQMTYDMLNNKVVQYGVDGQKAINLTMDLTAAAEGTKVYFTAFPAELKDFTVTAKTNRATYSKTVTEKSLSFKANHFVQFAVNNMTRKSTAKPVVTLNWDKNTLLDGNGGNFEIPYTIQDPVEAAVLELSSINGILKNLKAENNKITFSMDANPDPDPRSDYLMWEYKLGKDALASGNMTIKQDVKPAPNTPILTITWDNKQELDGKGGNFTIPYTIENPVEGAALVLSTVYSIPQNLKAENGIISFTLDANPEQEVRKDYLFCEYKKGNEVLASQNLDIRQAVNKSKELTFTLETVTIKQTAVYVNCIPSDLNETYILTAVEKGILDQTTDEQYMKDKLAEWKSSHTYIPDLLKKGEQQYMKIELPRANTEYYVIAYGMKEDGTFTNSKIEKLAFRSAGDPPSIAIDGSTWDNSAIHPGANGHHDVTVNITNPVPGTDLVAESQTGWIVNVTVTKVSDSQYTVGFDVIDYDYSTRSGKIKLSYEGAYSKNITYQRGYN